MTAALSIAITADLHWGHRKGHEATRELAEFLRSSPPDVLILAGDVGTGVMFEDALGLFADLSCIKAVVPGNHDLWVSDEAAGYNSLDLFEKLLPEAAARQGFHYLDRGPLVLPGGELGLVGTINWYDYSWGIDGLRKHFPNDEHRLHSKRFTRGKHNDGNFVRWPIDDALFTSLVTGRLERNLQLALEQVDKLVLVAHHPPYYDLGFPRDESAIELDGYLWDAFCGNMRIEQLLERYASRIVFAFCGHTHRARESRWQGIRGYNVGSDYHFKRLLWLEWPTGTMTARDFGQL